MRRMFEFYLNPSTGRVRSRVRFRVLVRLIKVLKLFNHLNSNLDSEALQCAVEKSRLDKEQENPLKKSFDSISSHYEL